MGQRPVDMLLCSVEVSCGRWDVAEQRFKVQSFESYYGAKLFRYAQIAINGVAHMWATFPLKINKFNMKKEIFPHLEAAMFLEVERQLHMKLKHGFGTNDFCRSACISVHTFQKWRRGARSASRSFMECSEYYSLLTRNNVQPSWKSCCRHWSGIGKQGCCCATVECPSDGWRALRAVEMQRGCGLNFKV